MEYRKRKQEDEPPDQIQTSKGNDNNCRGIKHTLGDLYRFLLWRGTVLHRNGILRSSGSGITSRWLRVVLGIGEHEGKIRQR